MATEKQMIDFEKARKDVMDILAGKVTTAVAVKVALAMKAASVDAVEVVHGQWEQGDYYDLGDVCSICDWDSSMDNCDWSYCPNCGAKMEE